MDSGDELLTAEEVARWLKVSTGWVYKAAARGELPAVKVGRHHLRFIRSQVLEELKRQQAGRQAQEARDAR